MEDKEPLVSICCITYNHEKYIRDAIEGFLMQRTSFPIEIIIHDDASTDTTSDIIRGYVDKFPNLITPIIQKENQYSKGIKPLQRFILPRARGKYIAICEGDDYWTDPLKLQKQVDFLNDHPDISFCSHNVNKVDQNNNIIEENNSKMTNYFKPKEVVNNHFPTLSLLFRNQKLEYTPELLNVFNGDAVLTALLSLHGGAANLGFTGACYRVHSEGIYSKQTYLENYFKSVYTREKLISSGIFPEEISNEIKQNIRTRKYKAIKYCLKRVRIISLLRVVFR
jgi:glycosyltransferase involved in cell wall biosynthesis